MHLTFTPQRSDEALILEKSGEALVVNGKAFDFGPLGEGDSLPASAIDSPWFTGEVTRQAGEIQLTLVLPIGNEASETQRFPQPVQILADGPVELPQ